MLCWQVDHETILFTILFIASRKADGALRKYPACCLLVGSRGYLLPDLRPRLFAPIFRDFAGQLIFSSVPLVFRAGAFDFAFLTMAVLLCHETRPWIVSCSAFWFRDTT
jgi:hypothetical protein